MAVLVWLAAVAFCSAEPLFDHHHDSAAAHTDEHHDADSSNGSESHHSGPHDDAFCVSLKSIDHSAAVAQLPKPDVSANLDLAFLWIDQQILLEQPIAAITRQATPRDWVFTPEVCLGPAFRSLAPPVLL